MVHLVIEKVRSSPLLQVKGAYATMYNTRYVRILRAVHNRCDFGRRATLANDDTAYHISANIRIHEGRYRSPYTFGLRLQYYRTLLRL